MTLGVTVGKFYPFHLGHNYLIEEAKRQVDHLVVVVGYKPTQELSGSLRTHWIKSMHPDIEVIASLEDIPNASEPWAQRTLEILAGRQPDVAFTSEDYGESWAKFMGAEHLLIDIDRSTYPISGTELRANLKQHWDMLTPPAKAYFAKRVCVIGVESSGTTTLARSLAQYYQTVWVPEYGRWYWEGRRYTPNAMQWSTQEFVHIAKEQIAWEENLAMQANQLVVCDTDPLATHVWHRRYMDHYAEAVERIVNDHLYNLYILTVPDFGFVQDGTRESKQIRMVMHEWLIEVLNAKDRPYISVTGSHETRMKQSMAHIDSLLTFDPLAEP